MAERRAVCMPSSGGEADAERARYSALVAQKEEQRAALEEAALEASERHQVILPGHASPVLGSEYTSYTLLNNQPLLISSGCICSFLHLICACMHAGKHESMCMLLHTGHARYKGTESPLWTVRQHAICAA